MLEKILQYFGFGRPTAEDPSQPDGAKAPASDEAPAPKSRAQSFREALNLDKAETPPDTPTAAPLRQYKVRIWVNVFDQRGRSMFRVQGDTRYSSDGVFVDLDRDQLESLGFAHLLDSVDLYLPDDAAFDLAAKCWGGLHAWLFEDASECEPTYTQSFGSPNLSVDGPRSARSSCSITLFKPQVARVLYRADIVNSIPA